MDRITHNIVLCDLATVDLEKYEPLENSIVEGNRGTVDAMTGSIIQKPSAFSEASLQIEAAQEVSKVNEALSKNPTKKK